METPEQMQELWKQVRLAAEVIEALQAENAVLKHGGSPEFLLRLADQLEALAAKLEDFGGLS